MRTSHTRSTTTIASAGLLCAAVLAFALLAPPPEPARTADAVQAASGPLTIEGRPAADHVLIRLSANGKRLQIRGKVRASGPHKCKKRRHGTRRRCPVRRVTAVLVHMGGGGDKLEILDTLPVPVTGHLGSGSDKMIGAGETDFCYPGGARRNRCIGGGGDDVCVTGPRNSDCVGGPGNDYCEASTGSDGCWGGPGADICKMGPGKDGCHGDSGNDQLYEGSGGGKLYGGRGNDRLHEGSGRGKLFGGGGNDFCDGGPGVGRSYTCEAGPRH